MKNFLFFGFPCLSIFAIATGQMRNLQLAQQFASCSTDAARCSTDVLLPAGRKVPCVPQYIGWGRQGRDANEGGPGCLVGCRDP